MALYHTILYPGHAWNQLLTSCLLRISIKVWSHLLLFTEFSQVKTSHFTGNLGILREGERFRHMPHINNIQWTFLHVKFRPNFANVTAPLASFVETVNLV